MGIKQYLVHVHICASALMSHSLAVMAAMAVSDLAELFSNKLHTELTTQRLIAPAFPAGLLSGGLRRINCDRIMSRVAMRQFRRCMWHLTKRLRKVGEDRGRLQHHGDFDRLV